MPSLLTANEIYPSDTMRLFGIQPSGTFREYAQTPFDVNQEEAVLEKCLKSNSDSLLGGDRMLIIGRQVRTNLGGYIDLLGIDREGSVAVVELKRARTPRDSVAGA